MSEGQQRDYFGKPVSTHRFFPDWSDPTTETFNVACAVWRCGKKQSDPVHDYVLREDEDDPRIR